MAGYVEGVDRGQATLSPDRLDDVVDANDLIGPTGWSGVTVS
jgi:hypothetical protein